MDLLFIFQAFEKWKKKKAAYLKQQIQKEKRVERLKKKEQELVTEKRKDNRSAIEKWQLILNFINLIMSAISN